MSDAYMNDDTLENFPAVSEQLVKRMEEVFPPVDHSFNTELRFIDFYSGQRAVVRWLRQVYEDQNENILNNRRS